MTAKVVFPSEEKLTEAIENAMSISFDHYASQVLAYLDPEQAPLYEGKETWEAMQDAVVARLERGS